MTAARALLVPLLLPALALTACGEQTSATDAPDPTPTTLVGETSTESPAQPEVTHPSGADDVLLSVTTAGGFTPIEYQQVIRPDLYLLGDGRVVAPSPGADPTGLMLPLEVHEVDEARIAEVLTLAEEAGLLEDDADLEMTGGAMVSDAPTTTLVLTTGEPARTVTTSAYALGEVGTESGRRGDLAEFVAEATDLLTGGSTPTPYEPEQVRLHVADLGSAGGGGQVPTADWPATAPALASFEDCQVVAADLAGDDVLVDTLTGSGWTTFVQDGRRWSVVGAAVLPGESTPCG
ncbi:MAG: hypothetical protein CMH83_22075 [Nocardioides sp.]|nr:hypothetical protein [Nocardioides sp.]